MSHAVIVGAGGQDGQILRQRLQAEGVQVTPIGREDLDLECESEVGELLSQHPSEVYFLAAHHHSSQDPLESDDALLYAESHKVHATGAIHFLEAIRQRSPETRFFYASSALVFGNPTEDSLNEESPIRPECLYGITKAEGMRLCAYYRSRHGVRASVGILFNHESLLRKPKFLIPKVLCSAIAISRGGAEKLVLGDLSARVDWGYAPDYVDAMVRILRLDTPDDFVIASGETHSVSEVVEFAFSSLGLDWKEHVVEAPSLLHRRRRTFSGDTSRLRNATGWEPSLDFRAMLQTLLDGWSR